MKKYFPTTRVLVVVIAFLVGTAYTHFTGISKYPDAFHLGLTGWPNAILITMELSIVIAIVISGIISIMMLLDAYDKWRKK